MQESEIGLHKVFVLPSLLTCILALGLRQTGKRDHVPACSLVAKRNFRTRGLGSHFSG